MALTELSDEHGALLQDKRQHLGQRAQGTLCWKLSPDHYEFGTHMGNPQTPFWDSE